MPNDQFTNPLAGENLSASVGSTVLTVQNGDTVVLPVGAVVEWITPLTNTGTPQVKRSATTADFLLAGVVIGGNAVGVSALVGGATLVLVEGITLVTFDANNTTAGHLAFQSTATAGQATDSATALVGKTIGTILNTVTLSSPGLVAVYVHKM